MKPLHLTLNDDGELVQGNKEPSVINFDIETTDYIDFSDIRERGRRLAQDMISSILLEKHEKPADYDIYLIPLKTRNEFTIPNSDFHSNWIRHFRKGYQEAMTGYSQCSKNPIFYAVNRQRVDDESTSNE